MKKFMAIYVADRTEIDKYMAKPAEERQKEGKKDMELWNAWMTANAGKLADGGSMFGKTKRITASGAVDAKNELTGYTIVNAESYDDAVALFKDHPYLPWSGAKIEVMECLEMK